MVVIIASTHFAYPRRDGQAELAWGSMSTNENRRTRLKCFHNLFISKKHILNELMRVYWGCDVVDARERWRQSINSSQRQQRRRRLESRRRGQEVVTIFDRRLQISDSKISIVKSIKEITLNSHIAYRNNMKFTHLSVWRNYTSKCTRILRLMKQCKTKILSFNLRWIKFSGKK